MFWGYLALKLFNAPNTNIFQLLIPIEKVQDFHPLCVVWGNDSDVLSTYGHVIGAIITSGKGTYVFPSWQLATRSISSLALLH